MEKHIYVVVVRQSGSSFVAAFPDFPDCRPIVSHSAARARAQAAHALREQLDLLVIRGMPIPAPMGLNGLPRQAGDTVIALSVNWERPRMTA